MSETRFTKEHIKQAVIGKLQRYYARKLEDATPYQLYFAVASTMRDQIAEQWLLSRERDDREGGKRL